VVVDNPDLAAIAVFPDKTDPPLIVDADAVLPLAISLQGFQAIGWRMRKSSRCCALFSMRSLRRAMSWMLAGNLRERSPCQIASVSLSEIENHAQS
jgi:hypothetical protein